VAKLAEKEDENGEGADGSPENPPAAPDSEPV